MAVKKLKIKKDYNTILLEKLGHDFGVFGEVLSHVKDKVDYVAVKVDRLEEDTKQVKADIVLLREDTNELKKDTKQLKGDMMEVKVELGIIRNDLKEKVGRDEFKLLEQRVLRLEKTGR
ncbi:MAG: hypothetical protein Q8Q95_01050 [bacterium]|nr:hypothetical protein [bacterium]